MGKEMGDVLRDVRLIHQRSQSIPFTCTEDGKPWPCPTVRVLRHHRAMQSAERQMDRLKDYEELADSYEADPARREEMYGPPSLMRGLEDLDAGRVSRRDDYLEGEDHGGGFSVSEIDADALS